MIYSVFMRFRGDIEALVLGVLQDGALHGYEISKRIRAASEGALSYGEGQLYPVLHALESDGHVRAEWIAQTGKPSRKVYAITPEGLKELDKRRATWQKFATGISAILAVPPTAKEGGHA